jgi:hypothetical protein
MQIQLRFYSFNWKYYPMWSVINDVEENISDFTQYFESWVQQREGIGMGNKKNTTNMSYEEI